MSNSEFRQSQFPEQRDRRYLDGMVSKIEGDIAGIKDALKDLAASVNRLAVVEERLGNTNQALERAFKALAKVEDRVGEVESLLTKMSTTTAWIDKAIYGTLGILGMYAANHLGLLK